MGHGSWVTKDDIVPFFSKTLCTQCKRASKIIPDIIDYNLKKYYQTLVILVGLIKFSTELAIR